MKIAIYAFVVLLLTACQTSSHFKLIYPDKIYKNINWTEDELNKDIAIRHLYRGTDTSTHLIRLKGKEFPHYHDRHDLNISILSGKSIMHFKDHEVSLMPGDVIFIPKGTFHWAENKDSMASVVFAVFSPAFDAKDRRKAD